MKLTVVGGSYWESCAFPHGREFFGSGLRAALAFSRLVPTTLHTLVGANAAPLLKAATASGGVGLVSEESPCTYSFEYLHGLAAPVFYPGGPGTFPTLSVEADLVLAFGMMEGNAVVHGKTVVYDPQSPNSPASFHANGSKAERLAIVCNQMEACNLTRESDLCHAGEKLLRDPSTEVVVIKDGAKGALVFTKASPAATHIPAFLLKPKSLIGSGDIFSAAFAYHWSVKGMGAQEAALAASKAAAYYCSTLVLPIFPELLEKQNWRPATAARKKAYLAGPFFSPAQLWMVEETRRCLSAQGLSVFSPYHEIGLGEPKLVAPQDIEAMSDCDLIFALLDGQDAGTLFEVGYARSIKKRVVAYHTCENKRHLTMLEGSDCDVHDNFVSAIYSAAWEE